MFSFPLGLCRILSDWLEVKFGSDGVSDSGAEQMDGTMRTLCVSDTLLEKDECRVYVSIKVRSEHLRGFFKGAVMLTGETCIIIIIFFL